MAGSFALTDELRQQIRLIPAKPGVYLMRDRTGTVIYVGKSRRLDRRVRSYFARTPDNPKIGALVVAVTAIEFIVTATEVEALILENNLIKRYKPRYNTMLKDSKTHPYLCVSLADLFPRLTKVRHVRFGDGNKYFGPFPSEGDLRHIIELLSRAYRLCQGKNRLNPDGPPQKACLHYHLHGCLGACIGKVSPQEYRRNVDQVVAILEGRTQPDYAGLEAHMQELAAAFRYEEAGELRNTIHALKTYFAVQNVEVLRKVESDIWGVAESVDIIAFSVFFVRAGKLLGHRTIEAHREPGAKLPEILGSLMMRFYDVNLIPGVLLSRQPPAPLAGLREYFQTRAGRTVRFAQPKRGAMRRLLAMADENALEVLRNLKSGENERVAENVLDLERRLHLPRLPHRIECVDISHTQGTDPVASLVVFVNGKPQRSEYRMFHIKSFSGIDDPRAIGEVTRRRFQRVITEGGALCDLFLVDGGIAQARAAAREMAELQVDRPVWGLAKREEILVPPHGEQIQLPSRSPGLRLVVALRNEAHRFANRFRKRLASTRVLRSSLLSLPGVGPKTIERVIAAFGSTMRAGQHPPEEIARRAHIPLPIARIIAASLADSPPGDPEPSQG